MPRTTAPAEPVMTGPADTSDPSVLVSTTTPKPAGSDLISGTTAGATEVPERPQFVEPLRLVEEERWESYDLVAPGGEVCEVTRNIDTGEHNVKRTGRFVVGAPADIAD